jgi:thiol-disulfide isomerase/thioredoxin
MKKLFVLIAFLVCSSSYGQSIIVAHINADFNIQNDWSEMTQLQGAKLLNGYIDKKPALKEAYNIKYVPTLIIFKDGKEIKRYEAGLDMKLHIKLEDVQAEINKL